MSGRSFTAGLGGQHAGYTGFFAMPSYYIIPWNKGRVTSQFSGCLLKALDPPPIYRTKGEPEQPE
jgi:hypothetical protein